MGPYSLNDGALAPVRDEVDCAILVVEGVIPQNLNGTLLRNGPNPFSGEFAGDNVLAWRPEAAMLHAVTFQQGRVTGYRNRWVLGRVRFYSRVVTPSCPASTTRSAA